VINNKWQNLILPSPKPQAAAQELTVSRSGQVRFKVSATESGPQSIIFQSSQQNMRIRLIRNDSDVKIGQE
jgi:hypothetical protein